MADRRVKVREIVDAIGISYGSVVSILLDQLGLRKLSAKWVTRLLKCTGAHMCSLNAKVHELGYELVPHLQYSPD